MSTIAASFQQKLVCMECQMQRRKPYKISSDLLRRKFRPWENYLSSHYLVTKFLGKKIPAAGGFYLKNTPITHYRKCHKILRKGSNTRCFLYSFMGIDTRIYAKNRTFKKRQFYHLS